MTAAPHVGVNPLPRILRIDGSFQLHMPTLHQPITKIATTGFNAEEIDPPSGMPPLKYGQFLLGTSSSPISKAHRSRAMCLNVTTHGERVRA